MTGDESNNAANWWLEGPAFFGTARQDQEIAAARDWMEGSLATHNGKMQVIRLFDAINYQQLSVIRGSMPQERLTDAELKRLCKLAMIGLRAAIEASQRQQH